MKIIEALKNLKTIEKRVQKNCEQLLEYSGWVSTETPAFETEYKQKIEVASLIQANLDLEKEYLRLKTAIETTNLAINVAIGDLTYSISNLVSLKRNMKAGKDFRLKTYKSLDARAAVLRMQQIYTKGFDAANPPKVIVAFKEEDKNSALREWENFLSQIDGKLEVVNAETELQGY